MQNKFKKKNGRLVQDHLGQLQNMNMVGPNNIHPIVAGQNPNNYN